MVCYKRAGQTVSDIFLFIVRSCYLTTVEGKELLPGTELGIWAMEAGETNSAWLWVCALWFCYLSGLILLSFIYEDVGEPTSHPCSLLKQQRFFSCIAGLVRDMVGQQLELIVKTNFPEKKNNRKKKQPTNNAHTPARHQARQKAQGNLRTKWNRWNIRAPLSPSKVLFHQVVILHVVHVQMSAISISAPWYPGASLTSGRRRRLSWYVPSRVCHLFAQFSMNASTSDCAAVSLSESAFSNVLKS